MSIASQNTDENFGPAALRSEISKLAQKHLQRYRRRQPSLAVRSLESLCDPKHSEAIVERWLEALLGHLSLQSIGEMSEQDLFSALCMLGVIQDTQAASSTDVKETLLMELRHRIVRLAGAELTCAFVSMAPGVIEESAVASVYLTVESRQLEGIRYQGEIYRLVKTYLPCHRLQAFCEGQSLNKKSHSYLITRSAERFAVWINIKALSGVLPSAHSGNNGSNITGQY